MTIAAVLLLSLAAALGLYLGLCYLRGRRNRPMLIGTHLLLGIGGAEALLLAHRSVASGGAASGSSQANLALGLIAAAIFAGFLAPVVGRNSRATGNLALAAHATLAAAGVGVALVWASYL
jgi:hypothetical protein